MKAENYRRDSELSYTLGAALTIELLRRVPDKVTGVFLHPDLSDGDGKDLIYSLCRSLGIEVTVGERAFNILSQKENCFAIGQFRKFYGDLDSCAPHVMLVNPSNAGNLGTIMRTAAGFGVPDIAVVTPAVDAFDPKTVLASMGAAFNIRIAEFASFDDYAVKFSEHAFYPFMLNAKHRLGDMVFDRQPATLIFGNEATGLPESFGSLENGVVICHGNTIDSLNLPIAAGIALYEFTRKRWN